MEKIDQESHKWGWTGRNFLMHKMWVLNASGLFIAEHLNTLMEYPPSQGAESLSLRKAVEEVQEKMRRPVAGGGSR